MADADDKKKVFRVHLDEKSAADLVKAKEWFGYSSDEEVVGLAFALVLRCYQAEKAGDKFCVWHPLTKEGEIVNLHNDSSEIKTDEVKVEVEFGKRKKKDLKN